MGEYGFTVRFLLGITALMCGVLALMRYPTHFNVIAMFSITLSVLVAAMIGAITARGTVQAFCVGFAIAGGIHLVLAFTGWFGKGTNQVLFSRYCLDQLAASLDYRPVEQGSFGVAMEDLTLSYVAADYAPGRVTHYYKCIAMGQSLITLILAMVGGWLGAHFHALRSETKSRDQSSDEKIGAS